MYPSILPSLLLLSPPNPPPLILSFLLSLSHYTSGSDGNLVLVLIWNFTRENGYTARGLKSKFLNSMLKWLTSSGFRVIRDGSMGFKTWYDGAIHETIFPRNTCIWIINLLMNISLITLLTKIPVKNSFPSLTSFKVRHEFFSSDWLEFPVVATGCHWPEVQVTHWALRMENH